MRYGELSANEFKVFHEGNHNDKENPHKQYEQLRFDLGSTGGTGNMWKKIISKRMTPTANLTNENHTHRFNTMFYVYGGSTDSQLVQALCNVNVRVKTFGDFALIHDVSVQPLGKANYNLQFGEDLIRVYSSKVQDSPVVYQVDVFVKIANTYDRLSLVPINSDLYLRSYDVRKPNLQAKDFRPDEHRFLYSLLSPLVPESGLPTGTYVSPKLNIPPSFAEGSFPTPSESYRGSVLTRNVGGNDVTAVCVNTGGTYSWKTVTLT